MAANLRKVYKG